MRPYYWPQRLLIALACVGTVLVLSLSGCETATWSGEIKACADMCRGAAASFSVVRVDWVGGVPQCICRAAADGGRP